jgi:hypothetical protein
MRRCLSQLVRTAPDDTAITTINAMNAGPISHATPWTPATMITIAAPPSSTINPRGRPHRRGVVSAAASPGLVMGRR